MLSKKYTETPNLNWVYTKIRKIDRPWSRCIQFWRWSAYTIRPTPSHSFHDSPRGTRKAKILPISLSQIGTKMRIRLWPKANYSWRWSRCISIPYIKPFLPWVPKPNNLSGQTNEWPVIWSVGNGRKQLFHIPLIPCRSASPFLK